MADPIELGNLRDKTVKELQIVTIMTLNEVCRQQKITNGRVGKNCERLDEAELYIHDLKEKDKKVMRRSDRWLLIVLAVVAAAGGIIGALIAAVVVRGG